MTVQLEVPLTGPMAPTVSADVIEQLAPTPKTAGQMVETTDTGQR